MNLDEISSYSYVIGASVIIIISYFFNIISKKWSIPSVLLLIVLGLIIRWTTGIHSIDGNSPLLGALGVVGLIMIVLEASLDLELKKEKMGMILKSFLIAIIALSISSYLIALVLQWVFETNLFVALLYAIPLSIMSSAIIIPSVDSLSPKKREFMIYESAFSDILGIMFFYFLLGSTEYETANALTWSILWNVLLTIFVSLLFSYTLIYVFQKIGSQTKLFLLIAVLILLYTIGKMMHLSSLIIILFFGLILHNRTLFFRGNWRKVFDMVELEKIYKEFKLITEESSFVVRTFFFVIFGITISLSALFKWKVIFVSLVLLAVLYAVRWLVLVIFLRKNIMPELFIAPRGLITILLFFAIPKTYILPNFEEGILFFIIITSSVIMAVTLIKNRRRKSLEEKQIAQEEEHQTNLTEEESSFTEI